MIIDQKERKKKRILDFPCGGRGEEGERHAMQCPGKSISFGWAGDESLQTR